MRTSMSRDEAQQFPSISTSNFRQTREPTGFNFEPVTFLDDSFWFIPNSKYTLVAAQSAESSEIKLEKRSNFGAVDGKLIVINTANLPIYCLGSGLVIDTTTCMIVGCYKTFAKDKPSDAYDLEVFVYEARDQLAELHKDSTRPGLRGAQKAALTKKIRKLGDRIRRSNGLLLDSRPVSLSSHQDGEGNLASCLELDPRIQKKQLRRAAKSYGILLKEQRKLMGEVWKEKEDVPMWYVKR